VNASLQALQAEAAAGGLGDWPRLLLYLLAALVCAWLGSSASLAQRTPRRLQTLWLLLGALYLLAAASALLQGDVWWVHWAREQARAQQAYGERRWLQIAALLLLLLLLGAAWKRVRRAAGAGALRGLLLAGACATLGLHLLRYVSFHYTDLALNAVWLGHSLGSWAELAALALAGAGTGLELLRSHGHV
jgi:cytochrome bd-type quinol oxidase subunit 2